MGVMLELLAPLYQHYHREVAVLWQVSIITVSTVTSLIPSPPQLSLLAVQAALLVQQATTAVGQRGYTVIMSITNPSSLKY